MIILEGPDGSGKTTLAKHLATRYDLEYMRHPQVSSTHGPTSTAVIDWWRRHMHENPLAVYDRCFWISERMYQPHQTHRALMLQGERMMFGLNALWNCEPLIIFCLPPEEVTIANVHAHPERLEGVTDEALRKIYWAYWGEEAMWQLALDTNVLHYSFTDDPDNLDFVQGEVMDFIKRRRLEVPSEPNPNAARAR